MTTLRPWASAKKAPMTMGPRMLLTDTLIGLLPVWSRSSTPGLPTYLQTKTFFGALTVVVGVSSSSSGFGLCVVVVCSSSSCFLTVVAPCVLGTTEVGATVVGEE